jgi:hypothetical protein
MLLRKLTSATGLQTACLVVVLNWVVVDKVVESVVVGELVDVVDGVVLPFLTPVNP